MFYDLFYLKRFLRSKQCFELFLLHFCFILGVPYCTNKTFWSGNFLCKFVSIIWLEKEPMAGWDFSKYYEINFICISCRFKVTIIVMEGILTFVLLYRL